MGAVGGILDAVDPPKYSLQEIIRLPEFEPLLRQLREQYGGFANQQDSAYRRFATQFGREDPLRRDQEIGSIDSYFNGGIESRLAGLRGNENNLFNAALERGLGGIDRGLGASAVAGVYSPRSSYGQRIRDRARTDMLTQNALRQAGQERADFSALENARMGLIGRRSDISARSLMPTNIRAAQLGNQTNLLSGIQGATLANRFQGVKKKRNQWADIMDSVDQGILNVVAAIGSFYGGSGQATQINPGGQSAASGFGGANNDFGGNARANQGAATLLNSGWGSSSSGAQANNQRNWFDYGGSGGTGGFA